MLCECGCGGATLRAPNTANDRGWVKGEPMRFILGHAARRPLDQRFWAMVEKTETCWLWLGGAIDGYGTITEEGRTVRAHRVSYKLHVGPIPTGLFVLHHCDVPSCVNPDHLFLGTHSDNMKDRQMKGRAHNWCAAKTLCPTGHPYDVPNTIYRSNGNRLCRACNRARCKKYHEGKL